MSPHRGRGGKTGRLVLLGLLGAIAGPILLSRIAFWDHLRRYGTRANSGLTS